MKILAFGASSNSNSINQKLALYAASQFTNASIETIDLNEFEMPLYSLDKEKTIGIPTAAKIFMDKIKEAEFIIISLAEHNGSYSVVFKNLFDWASRVNIKTFMGKPMLLMATSTGKRGGKSVLEAALSRFPYHDGKIIATFLLPEFNKNYNPDLGIINDEIKTEFQHIIKNIEVELTANKIQA